MIGSTTLRGCAALALAVWAWDAALAQDSDRSAWRILALRVDFPLEEPDRLSTTGTGKFDLRDFSQAAPDYAFPYDTPPHDREYFESHLEALARYYEVVSEGRVQIDHDVFPRSLEGAYTLPELALTYGNGRTEAEIGAKWAQLLADAVALADADPDGPDFGEYDSFLVFHAGVGHETGLLNDIRSVYLSAEDLARHRPKPIAVSGGAAMLYRVGGWILPEATSFQGQGGLNGLLAKFFGHQLGLPGLSNFADGLPALGGWSLMDIGANNLGWVLRDSLQAVVGFVPAQPMAWSKARLGWIDPVQVDRDTTIALLATDRSGDLAKAIRIPITPSEYFLLENRRRRGSTSLPEGYTGPYADREVVWIDSDDIEFSGPNGSGVWLGGPDYDVFVPGSGVLIWHVDEDRIADRISAGAINDDSARPGIALEEADGYRDIGNPVFERIREIEGSASDPFFVGGNDRFGPDTVPDSRSNSGEDSGIEVIVRSKVADTMWVEIRFLDREPGWPRPLEGAGRLQAADPDGDGDLDLIAEYGEGLAVMPLAGPAWRVAGGRLLASADGDGDGQDEVYLQVEDRVSCWELGADTPTWSSPLAAAASAALYSDQLELFPGRAVIVVASDGLDVWAAADGERLRHEPGSLAALTAVDLDGNGLDELVAGGESGLFRLEPDGLTNWGGGTSVTGLVAGDLDGDGTGTVLATPVTGEITLHGDDGSTRTWTGGAAAAASIGDMDGDGLLELILVTEDGLEVRRHDLTLQADFPVNVRGATGHPATLADLSGDGGQDMVVGAATGVEGVGAVGERLAGFPLLTSVAVVGQPVAADLDGDGSLQVAAAAADRIWIWRPRLARAGFAAGWGQRGQSAASTFAHLAIAPAAVPGDETLLPADRVYVYPNPVRGDGPANVRFALGEAAAVEVEIFDAIGTEIDKLDRPATATAPGENEISWSTAGYASGLYILRLSARSATGRTARAMVRLAVIR